MYKSDEDKHKCQRLIIAEACLYKKHRGNVPSARAAPPAGATAYRRWLASDVYTSSCSCHSPLLFCAHAHAISAPPRFICKQLMSHMVVCLISVFGSVSGQISITRSRGVTVSTLDPESSDRGSNPRETSLGWHTAACHVFKSMCGRKVL